MFAIKRLQSAEQSPTGKRIYILAAKSKDLPNYPPTDGCVRAQTLLSGHYVEEIEPGVLDAHFFIESDFKISLFIAKQVAPKSSNYAYFLREYCHKMLKSE